MPPALPRTLVLLGHRGHRPDSMATASASCAPLSPLAGPAQKNVLATHRSSRSFLICTGARWQEPAGGTLGHGSLQDPGNSLGLSPGCSVLTHWCHHEAHEKSLLLTIKLRCSHIAYLLKSEVQPGKLPQERVHKGSPHSM